MTNYHRHPTANPLDGIIIALMPSTPSTSSTEPPPAQHIPPEQPNMHQFLWIWDHRAGMDAEHLVEKYGVSVSHRVVPQRAGDLVGFSVPDHQAKWAEYLLLRAGYALTVPLLNPANAKLLAKAQTHGASRPTGGSERVKRHGLTDRLFHGIDAILGIGQSGRNRNLPGQQTWQPARPASPLAPRPSFLATIKQLIWGD
ncbi:MAG: hypothetical protein H6639_23815 [Caldilineaceae bacterium]|nr:hypothetical protein [Caldilineaceae bacterium]MCB9125603.1 hypothetical protein [Caldilineaceae bacterium]